MFAIVGQVERPFRGREAFQEIDQVTTLGGLAKWAAEPRNASEAAAAMAEATRQALDGRPGPVLLSFPEDLLDETMPADAQVDNVRPAVARATDGEVRAIVEFLASTRRPVILAGAGILRAAASAELTRFAELLQVPVIAAWRRPDIISNAHPLYLGMTLFGAASSVRRRLDAADALVVIGSRLNEPTTFGYEMPRAGLPWAHVDLVPGAAAGSTRPAIAAAADAKAFLEAANEWFVGRVTPTPGWLPLARRTTRWIGPRGRRRRWSMRGRGTVQEFTRAVRSQPSGGICTMRLLTTEAGNFSSWAARGFRRPGTFLGPTSGAMGYGLPAAIAAALVHRDRPVVALVGDGGLAMTMAELETAARAGARVIVVVFDNQRYGTIRMWQERRGTGVGVATELGPVDFAAIARACGANGVRVERDIDFEPALRTAVAADRATLIHAALDQAWVSIDQLPA
jgi:acetolactate synthase-1/2/3 large subunit